MFRPRRQHSRVTKLNHMDIGILVPTKHQQLLPKNVVRKMRQILVCVAAHKATSEVVEVVKIIVALQLCSTSDADCCRIKNGYAPTKRMSFSRFVRCMYTVPMVQLYGVYHKINKMFTMIGK